MLARSFPSPGCTSLLRSVLVERRFPLLRGLLLLAVVCVAIGTSWAADDPFVGKWKVNPAKSTLIDEMKVEGVGGNKYVFTFDPDAIDTVVVDGTDQPAVSGTTLSVTVKGPNSWEVVRKMKGRVLLRAEWTLSEDCKTLRDNFTQYLPDGITLFSQPLPNGSTLLLPYVYERTAGNSGFAGTWDSESATASPRIELQVQRDESGGLSFKRSDEDTVQKFRLDGKDYPELDAKGADKGTAFSGRRVNERSIEITYKSKGKTSGTKQVEVSEDLKTLTMTERLVGQNRPRTVLVFDRQ